MTDKEKDLTARLKAAEFELFNSEQELNRIMQVHSCKSNAACVRVQSPFDGYIEQCKICGEVLQEYRS